MSPKDKGSIYGGVWKTKRDTSKDPKRAPGPIDLSRYVAHLAYSGPQTFCKVPVCLNQADLRAGKVDVAICGVPIDTSIGQRGAAHGPMAIRTAEKYIPGPRKGGFPHQHVRIDPFEVLRVVDYGDAAVHPLSIEESHQPIRQVIREIAETGAVPIVLGGDHSLMWPSCAALADVYGAGKIGVVHFDAHADCSPDVLGHLHAHGTPIRRLIEEEHVPARNFIQVGLRGYYPAEPGWLAITCESPRMAAWLCATIILENVDARARDEILLVPASARYRLEDEVKSVITVVAKTHHYWLAHARAECGCH